MAEVEITEAEIPYGDVKDWRRPPGLGSYL
jgi:hypothetical protein